VFEKTVVVLGAALRAAVRPSADLLLSAFVSTVRDMLPQKEPSLITLCDGLRVQGKPLAVATTIANERLMGIVWMDDGSTSAGGRLALPPVRCRSLIYTDSRPICQTLD
jgi:hypothetical protein